MEKELIEFSGVLPIYKKSGISSLDVSRELKKRFKFDKIGHLGTLDPLAEGVLPILINKATKIAQFVDNYSKRYSAVMRFGIETDSEDITGEIVSEHDWSHITREIFSEKILNFIGEIEQKPSKFSAIKINGKEAYKIARSGQEVDIPSRIVKIDKIGILNWSMPLISIDVLCSKGTYIRSLVRDIARALDSGATIQSLIRTESASIPLKNSVLLTDINTKGDIQKHLISISKMIPFKLYSCKQSEYEHFIHGRDFKVTIPQGNYQIEYNSSILGVIDVKNDGIVTVLSRF
ncbi:tRNA pseudouridine(55) synthase TruB [bacterium]|nr:tRNA pseudouridine(55) synthase TruB [bacterium]